MHVSKSILKVDAEHVVVHDPRVDHDAVPMVEWWKDAVKDRVVGLPGVKPALV